MFKPQTRNKEDMPKQTQKKLHNICKIFQEVHCLLQVITVPHSAIKMSSILNNQAS